MTRTLISGTGKDATNQFGDEPGVPKNPGSLTTFDFMEKGNIEC
jgi:hypothetical protein